MAIVSFFSLWAQPLRAAAPEGTVLRREWKQYHRLSRQDLPEDEIACLESILDKADRKRLPVDFYEAAVRCRDRRVSRSWKERTDAGKQFRERILSFGLPALTAYYYSTEDIAHLTEYVLSHADELRSGYTPALHGAHIPVSEIGSFLSFRNDLEYAAWLALTWTCDDRIAAMLEEEYAGSYPESAFLRYQKAVSKGDVKSSIKDMAQEYRGRGAAMLAENWLLRDKAWALTGRDTTSSETLMALRDECNAFEARFREMKKKEKWLGRGKLTAAEECIQTLTSKSVMARVENNVVKASFVNTPYADVTLTDGKKTVFRQRLVNPVCSFYKTDTASLALPAVDDGDYVLKVKSPGKDAFEVPYDKSSLSVAIRRHEDMLWMYVADFMTGKPVDKVDASVTREGSDNESARVEGILTDGFTPFPDALLSAIGEDGVFQLTCSYTDEAGRFHRSRAVQIDSRGSVIFASGTTEVTKAEIMLGSGAYHPGDSVRFKAVAYSGDIYSSLRTFKEGEPLKAFLMGRKQGQVADLDLVTNDFGSAEGVFVIPEDAEGGTYWVSVSYGKQSLGSKEFRVDEFVLPTFRIDFEDFMCYWFRGDSVTVRGEVKAYSGHTLTSAVLSYVCGKSVGTAEIGQDGSFSFSILPESTYSSCQVKVTDATGETVTASRDIMLRADANGTHFSLDGPVSRGKSSEPGFIIVSDRDVDMRFMWSMKKMNGVVPARVRYKVTHDGKPVCDSETGMGEDFRLSFTGLSCLYEIEAVTSVEDQSGVPHENIESFKVLYLADDADVIDAPVENFLKFIDGNDVTAQFGAGLGDVWAIAELWGCDHRLLREEQIQLIGGRGVSGSLRRIDWKYEADWPETVELRIFYFRNGRAYNLNHTYSRPRGLLHMPVKFTRFVDETLPGNSYEFGVQAFPDSECLVAVYDVSLDRIWKNRWSNVSLLLRPSYSGLRYNVCGSFDSFGPEPVLYKSAASGVRIRGKANTQNESDVMLDEAIPFQLGSSAAIGAVGYAGEPSSPSLADVDVRSEFADVLAFEPFLRTGEDGEVTFRLNTSDMLSTYHVAVFAHDRDMHNGTVTRDMTVSLPVKVSLVQPRILYEGDRYVLHANVSNSSDEDIDGIFGIDIFDGTVWKGVPALRHTQGKAHVPAGGSASLSFPVGRIPHCGSGVLGLKVVFANRNSEGMNVSDGMFVTVPVEAPEQEITEAHSALLMGGGDRRHLYDSLMAQFSNGRASETVSDEILIADQLHEVLDQSSETDAEDAVSLSSAMVFRMLASHLKGENADAGRYADALLMLQRADGGFAWLGGMESSAPVTAVVLERLARLKALGIMPAAIGTDVVASAVRYLDSQYFTGNRPSYWRPVLSQGQYFYVRSLYAEIPLVEKLDSQMKDGDRDYLTPSREYTGGCVFHKARRIRTIANLQSSDAGVALAKAWGVKLLTSRRLDRTLERDLASLMQYAVAHPSGGIFYPNAVMPWRGLMESELYAHSFICDLFRDIESSYPEHAARASEIAGGIRLWIMVQKETQKWASDPAFAEAVASVMDGSEALMDARVMVLKRSVRTPFSQVRKSGNGMSVDVRYSIRRGDRWVDLKGGEVLPVGETVRATYTLWSGENRSFVCLAVPRPGCLVPVVQTSGYTWWNCYRRVRSARTEYYWDAFPEEKTSVTEEFHVSQEGTFTAPAAHIESAYAPHYRANTGPTLPIRAELLN